MVNHPLLPYVENTGHTLHQSNSGGKHTVCAMDYYLDFVIIILNLIPVCVYI